VALGLVAAPACEGSKTEAQADGAAAAGAGEPGPAEPGDPKAVEPGHDQAKAPQGTVDEPPAPGEPAADVPKIGVPECDEYIATMNACFASDAIPAEERDKQKLGFDASVRGWADAVAANPDGSTALASGCKAALDMARIAYPGC